MARSLCQPLNSSGPPAKGPPTYQAPPQTIRTAILTASVERPPRRLTRHPPREFWQTSEICRHCKNYGPEGDVCTTCLHPHHYYGNTMSETDTIPLLAQLMAGAITREAEINVAQHNAESLIDFYIAEYCESATPGYPTDHDASKPATI
jgi:hypothetical protein